MTKKSTIFTVKEEHLKLLKAAHIRWIDVEEGAPGIDPKNPYGFSFLKDIAEIIGLELEKDSHGYTELNEEQKDLCRGLHQDMESVLQILCYNLSIEVGEYDFENKWNEKTQKYEMTWTKVAK